MRAGVNPELKGVPIRIELGARDLAGDAAVFYVHGSVCLGDPASATESWRIVTPERA